MFEIINSYVYKIERIGTNSQTLITKVLINCEVIQEEIKNEQDEVIETITKKFNLDTGEYEVV